MERRNLLKMIMAATGVAMVGGNAFAYEFKGQVPLSATVFSAEDVMLFNEIAEVIIPRTDTPGAKDANVGLMALILANDCYAPTVREAFIKGLQSINKLCQERFTKPYLLLNKEQKSEFVTQLDTDAKTANQKMQIHYVGSTPSGGNAEQIPHFFTLIKQLTLFSFFTSEIGATKVLRYEAVPGKDNGELEYRKGDRAWAT